MLSNKSQKIELNKLLNNKNKINQTMFCYFNFFLKPFKFIKIKSHLIFLKIHYKLLKKLNGFELTIRNCKEYLILLNFISEFFWNGMIELIKEENLMKKIVSDK
jgi:hypothetical protein